MAFVYLKVLTTHLKVVTVPFTVRIVHFKVVTIYFKIVSGQVLIILPSSLSKLFQVLIILNSNTTVKLFYYIFHFFPEGT